MKKSFLIYAPMVLFMVTSLIPGDAKANWLTYTDLTDKKDIKEPEAKPEVKAEPAKKDVKKKVKAKTPKEEKIKKKSKEKKKVKAPKEEKKPVKPVVPKKEKPTKKNVKVVTATPPKKEVKPEPKKEKLTYFHSNPTMIYEMAEDEQRGSHATGVLWTKEGDTWWRYGPMGQKEKSTPPKTMY